MSESTSLIPPEWQEKYLLKRIDEQDIEITLESRNAILASLAKGTRFIQLGKYTIMLNTIKSIEPKWGEDNIPPRPLPRITADSEMTKDEYGRQIAVVTKVCSNQKEIDLWDSLFANKLTIKK